MSANWQLGRVREVLNFSKQAYVEIFGNETGEVLYGAVRRKVLKQRSASDRSVYTILIFGLNPCLSYRGLYFGRSYRVNQVFNT